MPTDPPQAARARHDAAYRSVFAQGRAVADTLAAAAPKIASHLDFATLKSLPASFVTEDLRLRHADTLWRVQTNNGEWFYIMVLLEFQSTVQRHMALRMNDYMVRILEGLDRNERGPSGEYPAILPIVIYNGKPPWTAPRDIRGLFAPGPDELIGILPRHQYLLVDMHRLDPDELAPDSTLAAMVRMEQASTQAAVRKLIAPLGAWLHRIDDPQLSQAFIAWVCLEVLRRHGPRGEELARRIRQGEEITMSTIGDRMDQWGRERDQEWLARGIERGRIEGERRAVLRLAARRFGPGAAERLMPLLNRLSGSDAIDAVADAIFESDTSDELLARVGHA